MWEGGLTHQPREMMPLVHPEVLKGKNGLQFLTAVLSEPELGMVPECLSPCSTKEALFRAVTHNVYEGVCHGVFRGLNRIWRVDYRSFFLRREDMERASRVRYNLAQLNRSFSHESHLRHGSRSTPCSGFKWGLKMYLCTCRGGDGLACPGPAWYPAQVLLASRNISGSQPLPTAIS